MGKIFIVQQGASSKRATLNRNKRIRDDFFAKLSFFYPVLFGASLNNLDKKEMSFVLRYFFASDSNEPNFMA